MKQGLLPLTLSLALALLSANPSFALDGKADAPQAPASAARNSNPPSIAASKSHLAAKRQAADKTKLVNINAATHDELKTLPGIGDAEAEQIIAGRPYGSKAWLASKNILPTDKVMAIRHLIVAGKPYKPAAKRQQGGGAQ